MSGHDCPFTSKSSQINHYSLMPALHFEKLPESSRHGDAWQGIDAPIVPLSLSIEAYSFVTDYDPFFILYFLSQKHNNQS